MAPVEGDEVKANQLAVNQNDAFAHPDQVPVYPAAFLLNVSRTMRAWSRRSSGI